MSYSGGRSLTIVPPSIAKLFRKNSYRMNVVLQVVVVVSDKRALCIGAYAYVPRRVCVGTSVCVCLTFAVSEAIIRENKYGRIKHDDFLNAASLNMLAAEMLGGACVSVSDESLYNDFSETGNKEALKTLFERYRMSVVLFVFGYVRNIDDAEDIMMDTFAVIAAFEARFSGKSSFKTWLFSISHNLACKHIRKQSRLLFHNTVDLAEPDTSPEDKLLTTERDQRLYKAIGALNPDYGKALYLLYFEKMTNDDIGRIMRKNKSQVAHLLERGRKALKERLERSGFEYDGQ